MIDAPARFGVCTLRVEVQPEHLLITVTTSRYLAPGARGALPVRSRSYASVQEALEATEQFLDSFGTWKDSAPHAR